MVGTASEFLKYNEENVMMHLLAIENHLRDLNEDYASEHASCIVKHLLTLREQALEGISHASEVGSEDKIKIFKEIDDAAKRIRAALERREKPSNIIRMVREVRKSAEKLDRMFDLSKCASCTIPVSSYTESSNITDFNEKIIDNPEEAFKEMEKQFAQMVINTLSAHYMVDPPKLIIDEGCNKPNFGLYTDNTIYVCSGNINLHVLVHEFAHYLQDVAGRHLDEKEAEEVAIELLKKDLYPKKASYTTGDRKMALTWRETGLILGASHIFKGVERAADEVDRMMGKSAEVVTRRPSTYINVVGGLAAMLIPRFIRVPEYLDVILTVGGAHMTTKVWDYLEEKMVSGSAARVRGITYTAPAVKSVSTAQSGAGKYVITQ